MKFPKLSKIGKNAPPFYLRSQNIYKTVGRKGVPYSRSVAPYWGQLLAPAETSPLHPGFLRQIGKKNFFFMNFLIF